MSALGLPLSGASRTGAQGKDALRTSGVGAPRETRAAMSRAMEVLPEAGYPAMRVSWPRGMRLGQSQSRGWGMKKASGRSPASCAPVAVRSHDSAASPRLARASSTLSTRQLMHRKENPPLGV